ncbi:MAG: hypothetical protein EOR84_22720 [Mesorhizobium sp.]|uniref:hypothetical protein n=1 Tax=Mesorhizobium sp. TaxID=1871066 RepID=UPI000FE48C50|nr:hypothetical protein [Mesorhizobium sp.]RWM90026.1 MAG: hypothetical protein EOR84_22720 [Mesorhizobium sp.]
MWKRIKKFFKDSETIALARLQMIVGLVAAVLTYVDPQMVAPILPAEWVPWLIVAHGYAIEYLRRRRAGDLE